MCDPSCPSSCSKLSKHLPFLVFSLDLVAFKYVGYLLQFSNKERKLEFESYKVAMSLFKNKEPMEGNDAFITTSQIPDKLTTLETQVYMACRTGNAQALKLLLDANPGLSSTLNTKDKSALSLALLNESGMLGLGDDQTCIHVAVSGGHIGKYQNSLFRI